MAITPTVVPVPGTPAFLAGYDLGNAGISEAVTATDPDASNPLPARVRNSTPANNDAGQVARIPAQDLAGIVSGLAAVVAELQASLAERDIFANGITAQRYNQIEVDYSLLAPGSNPAVTVTLANGGTTSNVTGHAKFDAGTNTNGSVSVASVLNIDYRPDYEVYAAFTAAFSPGLANSVQQIGLFSTTDGFWVGYEGTQFTASIRFNSTDIHTPQASFNVDTLTGAPGSLFTRNGVPEALNPQNSNLYRIRFGWFGSAPVWFEVFSPDGQWVTFHEVKFPNLQLNPSLTTTVLPMRLTVTKTAAGATDLVMYSGCWAAGTTSALQSLTDTLTDTSLAQVTRSVIAGHTTGGGGGYVNVKVNPSGALVADVSNSTGLGVAGIPHGTPSYAAGSSGTVNVPTGTQVTAIACHSTTGGSLTIGGGATIPVPANGQFFDSSTPYVGPIAVVFTSTDSYYVAWST